MGFGANYDGARLELDTGGMRRTFFVRDDRITGDTIEDPRSGRRWQIEVAESDAGEGSKPASTAREEHTPAAETPGDETPQVEIRTVPLTRSRESHIAVTVHTARDGLEVQRTFRLFDGCPAIACEFRFRGHADNRLLNGARGDAGVGNIEDASLIAHGADPGFILDRLTHPDLHQRYEAIRFFDVTDRNNNLVRGVSAMPYRSPLPLIGNVLICDDLFRPGGLFLIKEAPGPVAHHHYPGFDFVIREREAIVVGIGLSADEIDSEGWVRGYGSVCGIWQEDEGVEWAIRDYQERLRRRIPERDEMILMNTWGDRGQDTRIGEEFAFEELACGARLGVTRLQLDDGWQAGRSSNSAFGGGSLESIWDNPDYWTPHPDRFPRGFAPVVSRAHELGIELCLWFNPSKDDSYAHWENDAETLIRLNREHGIRTFKIDGVMIDDKQGEINLRRMFDAVVEATDGEVVFNLDVTAGRRFGYFTFREYGNLFLENRYTDWSNYYPHWTLRNLWMLSRFVPPQSLQIEFLNNKRNPGNYPGDDPLAPNAVPFSYCFGVTLMAQPLAWFESTGLSESAFDLSRELTIYREHQHAIHAGRIFPIGEEPSGRSWTGFQSIGLETTPDTSESGSTGYVEVFREHTDRDRAILELSAVAGCRLHFEAVCGAAKSFDSLAGPGGEIEFALSNPLSYALYRYRVDR